MNKQGGFDTPPFYIIMNSMNDYRIVILATVVFIVAWLSIISYRKTRDRIAFSAFAGSIAFWALSLTFFYFAENGPFLDFWGRLVYISGGFIAFLFLRFALLFSGKKLQTISSMLLALPWAFLAYLYFFTPFLIKKILLFGLVKGFAYGPWHLLFDLYFGSYFILGFIVLARAFRAEDDRNKKLQFVFIITGTLIGLILSASTNIIMPWFNRFELLWAGPIGVAIWAGILTYGIMRHHLLNIRVIATEIFASIMWIFLFVNVFIFSSIKELLFNISVFIVTLLSGIFLIRSVVGEVEQKEELERLSNSLSHANEELKRLDETKSEFISIASHQLRSPLTAVKGYISILLEGTFGRLTAGQIEALHKIFVSTEHLIKLIDDLLNLSQIESGRMNYEFKKINLLYLVKEVIGEQELNIEKKNLRIIITEPSFAIPPIFADYDKIRQIILNLIDNAIRYTDKGGAEIRFYKKEVGGKKYLGMIVEDSGRGIDKEDIGHLFVKFVRAERTRKLYTEGSGLGLYVAKKIIDDHEGRIYVESEGVGKGSSFFVEFPIA